MRRVVAGVRASGKNGTPTADLRRQEACGAHLSWPSRTWEVGAARTPASVVRVDERFGSASGNRAIQGDCLDVAGALLDEGWGGKVDLVYVDPPFASQATYTKETRLDGPADGRVLRTRAYDDSWPARKAGANGAGADDGVGAYLDMLAPRLEAMTRLLATTGTIWVHVDWRAAYLVRVLLDEVLGRQAFLNAVVWRRAPNLGRQAASGQFGRTLDTLVVYGGPDAQLHPPTRLEPIPASSIRRDEAGRPFTTAPRGDYSDASMARLDAEGRVHRTATGRLYVKYFLEPNADGELCRERRIDTLWTDVPPLRHASIAERTGFPTQKPRALLERIIACASPQGGTVVDLFAGSGTTGEAAHVLGRRFVLGDAGPVAMSTLRARLLRAKASFTVESCGDAVAPEGAAPVVHVERDGEARTRVSLREPAEPLAWAVGAKPAEGEPFAPSWHSERRFGTVPIAALREAVVPSGPLEVRVYSDDGSVASLTHAAPEASA
jgi:DNA modification methylase